MPPLDNLSDSQAKGNTTILKVVCAVLPAALMAAAHYAPWRKVFHREPNNLQRYAMGTAAIVGTAAAAIAVSDGDRNDHASMLCLAASAAGATTVMAYVLDELIHLRAELVKFYAEQDYLNQHEHADR